MAVSQAQKPVPVRHQHLMVVASDSPQSNQRLHTDGPLCCRQYQSSETPSVQFAAMLLA